MRTILSTALIFFTSIHFTTLTKASTLVIPYPGLLEQEGMLQPSVILGKPGFTFDGQISHQPLPSKLSLSAALPFTSQKTLRNSGWMWAVRAGITEAVFENNKVFSAGHNFFELGLGRGTSSPLFEENTGLRGYMEWSLRSERPKLSSQVREVAANLNHDIEENKYFLSLKIGAGSAHDAQGIVVQKPMSFAFRVQSQLYIPIQRPGALVLNFIVQAYKLCGSERWICGVHSNYQHHFEAKRRETTYEELSDIASLGAWTSYMIKEDISYTAKFYWPFVGNANHFGFVKWPVLNLSITKAF